MELPSPTQRHQLTRQASITLIYLAVGMVWILVSDRVFAQISVSLPEFLSYQSIKGIIFVLVTALLLYFLLRQNFRQVETVNCELRVSYANTIRGWVRVMDARHEETRFHTERVQLMTVCFAREVGVCADQLEFIAWGALLHDIGKMGLDDRLIKKTGRFTDDERKEMQRHPELARQFLAEIEFLQPAVDIPWCHHENWDGSGYPRGLCGEAIPLAARLFAIVDVWDALLSKRSYKEGWSRERAIDYLKSERGTKFQPELLDQFLANLGKIERAVHRDLPELLD